MYQSLFQAAHGDLPANFVAFVWINLIELIPEIPGLVKTHNKAVFTAVGADYPVTAVDLASSAGLGKARFGIGLRESHTFRHFQYSCHYDLPISRRSGYSAGYDPGW